MNRLARERSPYLLQHAANPVDWYPWGDEAFERARREDKPIFLSIGYSTCHWCHVMEHESFENPAIAELLNRDFVSIKVDREERPDVDRVYMSFVQATTGSGGWPMTVFLTPELKPFFGGTYFPPTSRWGRPGFSDLLGELARVWKDERPRVEEAAARTARAAAAVTGTGDGSRARNRRSRRPTRSTSPSSSSRWRSIAATAASAMRRSFRVPRSCCSCCASTRGARPRARSPQAPLLMATETLRAMALGGMRDHIGGGFHRYSVDGEWRVPHFEKMLYDQAQLVLAYLEAAQATGETFYAAVAEDTLAYVPSRHDRSGGRVLFGGGCRQHSARAGRAQPARTRRKARSTSGATRRSARCSATTPTIARRAVRHRAGRQRAARSAGGVHRQEPAVYRAVDRGDRDRGPAGRPTRSSPRSAASAHALFDARETHVRGRISTTRS